MDKAWSPDRKTGLKRDGRNPTMSSGARISPEDHGPRRVMPELSLENSAVTQWRQARGGRWGERLEAPGGPRKCGCTSPRRKPKERRQFPHGCGGSWAEASSRSVRRAGAKGAAAFDARSQPTLSPAPLRALYTVRGWAVLTVWNSPGETKRTRILYPAQSSVRKHPLGAD